MSTISRGTLGPGVEKVWRKSSTDARRICIEARVLNSGRLSVRRSWEVCARERMAQWGVGVGVGVGDVVSCLIRGMVSSMRSLLISRRISGCVLGEWGSI